MKEQLTNILICIMVGFIPSSVASLVLGSSLVLFLGVWLLSSIVMYLAVTALDYIFNSIGY